MQNWEMKHFFPSPLAGLHEKKKRKQIPMPKELIAVFSSCSFAHKWHASHSPLEFGPHQHQEKAEKLQEVVLESLSPFSHMMANGDSTLQLIITIIMYLTNGLGSRVTCGHQPKQGCRKVWCSVVRGSHWISIVAGDCFPYPMKYCG